MAKSAKKWSAEVTAHDHPFDLEPGLFANGSAQQIAAALKKSAGDPRRNSDDPYLTAMSMLDFYGQSRGRQTLRRSARQARPGQDGAQTVLRALGRGKLLIKSSGPLHCGPLLRVWYWWPLLTFSCQG